jgi:hypothetical protein
LPLAQVGVHTNVALHSLRVCLSWAAARMVPKLCVCLLANGVASRTLMQGLSVGRWGVFGHVLLIVRYPSGLFGVL